MRPEVGEAIYEKDNHTYEDVEEVLDDLGDGRYRVLGTSGEEFIVEEGDCGGWDIVGR